MVTKLYYGNGEVTISGSHVIRGIEIRYSGNIEVEKTAGDNFTLIHNNNGIIIFPTGVGYLNDLFKYSGTMEIKSVIVADNNGEEIRCYIKRVMDYSELLNSTSETMTTKSEHLSAGHSTTRRINTTPQIIENLNTNNSSAVFYLKDGNLYKGAYHIHLKDSSCMTGSVHDENSQDLYFKQVENGEIIDKLIPTKNPSHVPPASKLKRKMKRRRRGGSRKKAR